LIKVILQLLDISNILHLENFRIEKPSMLL